MVLLMFWFLGTLPVIFFYRYGALDEMDFWAGTVGLVVFALIEITIFNLFFGTDRGWKELHLGAEIRVPDIFRFVVRYVTPLALLAICVFWFYDAIKKDLLIPTPKIRYDVVDRPSYPGDFEAGAVGAPDEPEARRSQKEAERIEADIRRAVEAAKHDLNAWAEVAFDDAGAVRVTSYTGDPGFGGALDGPTLERYLNLVGFHYETGGSNGSRPSAARATLAFAALNRGPYIWLTRLLMVVVNIVFLVAIHTIWNSRARGEEEPA